MHKRRGEKRVTSTAAAWTTFCVTQKYMFASEMISCLCSLFLFWQDWHPFFLTSLFPVCQVVSLPRIQCRYRSLQWRINEQMCQQHKYKMHKTHDTSHRHLHQQQLMHDVVDRRRRQLLYYCCIMFHCYSYLYIFVSLTFDESCCLSFLFLPSLVDLCISLCICPSVYHFARNSCLIQVLSLTFVCSCISCCQMLILLWAQNHDVCFNMMHVCFSCYFLRVKSLTVSLMHFFYSQSSCNPLTQSNGN